MNHLAPYPTWEEFRPFIFRALEAYVDAAKPTGIERIGLRYINVIPFPPGKVSFPEYLRFYPHIFGDPLGPVHAFNVQVHSYFESGRDELRLQVANYVQSGEGEPTALLDIDYYLAKPEAVGLAVTPDWLDVAHEHVQSVFEASLTDRAKGRFGRGRKP